MAVKHGSDVGERLHDGPPRFDEVAGREEVLPQQSPTHPFRADDVVYVRGMGGGGYGDPTRRDPRLVAADVADGLVSPGRARSVYAVVVDASGRVDESATAALRTTSASTETAPSP